MKVKCIDNKGAELWLTIGKEYDATVVNGDYFCLTDDKNESGEYFKWRFEIVEETPSLEIQEKSTIQSLITELNTVHKELEVCVIIHHWGYFIHSWFGEFKAESEQDVLEALNEMLKLVKKYKGGNHDND